jgi:hypothetical protein
MKKSILCCVALLCACSILFSFYTAETKYDICVYGETSSGVMAAVEAGRKGKSVVLISTNNHVGGMATSGLTATDLNNFRAAGGITREFFQRIYTYYKNPSAWKNQDRDTFFEVSKKRTFTGKNDSLRMQWVYESHVGELVMKQMLTQANVNVVYNERLDLKKGVAKKNAAITSILMESGKRFTASIFIDATYEGDLMATAGVSHMVGRESNSVYNETLNGIRLNEIVGADNKSIDPYIVAGNRSSGLLPFIEPKIPGPDGSGDHRTQAYCYRMTLTDDPANQVAITKPANYHPLWYEFLARVVVMNPNRLLNTYISFTPMPNKKTDTNQADFVGASYQWPEADYATRDSIARMHKEYVLGLLWFFGNDPRLPATMRTEMKRWGLPKDEFTDSQNFPYQLYVREARRMIGDYVMTERNCNGTDNAPEPVAVATYPLDCHFVSRVLDNEGNVHIEGSYGKQKNVYYTISYRSLIPKASQCTNLLVPVCLSSSHVAYSSIRMEPVYMVLGQSSAAAAVLALDTKTTLQQINYAALEQQLLNEGQVISLKR